MTELRRCGWASALIELQATVGSFADWVWAFVDGTPRQNRWSALAEVPASTPLSAEISTEMKRIGFRFVGPTTIYAFMQASGLVNDHVLDCFRHDILAG
ncbi:MAG: DNA-3-methyladenine glycosylase I [Acidimicrobiia bacterium]|nr:DNA-3-methyladenine glycosylase I [Acidimicrobiia bacterium]